MNFLKTVFNKVAGYFGAAVKFLKISPRTMEMSDIVTKLFYIAIILILAVITVIRCYYFPELLIFLFCFYLFIFIKELLRIKLINSLSDNAINRKFSFKFDIFKRIDPMGTVVLPLLQTIYELRFGSFIVGPVVGWMDDVYSDTSRLTDNRIKAFFIALSGMFISLFILILTAVALYILPSGSVIKAFHYLAGIHRLSFAFYEVVALLLVDLLFIAISSLVINLIPIPPFDMAKFFEFFGGYKVEQFMQSLRPFGKIIILILFYFNFFIIITRPLFVNIFNMAIGFLVA